MRERGVERGGGGGVVKEGGMLLVLNLTKRSNS